MHLKTGNVSISKHLWHIRVTIVAMETQKKFVFYCWATYVATSNIKRT